MIQLKASGISSFASLNGGPRSWYCSVVRVTFGFTIRNQTFVTKSTSAQIGNLISIGAMLAASLPIIHHFLMLLLIHFSNCQVSLPSMKHSSYPLLAIFWEHPNAWCSIVSQKRARNWFKNRSQLASRKERKLTSTIQLSSSQKAGQPMVSTWSTSSGVHSWDWTVFFLRFKSNTVGSNNQVVEWAKAYPITWLVLPFHLVGPR